MATYLESVEAQRKKREGQTLAPYWQAAQRELAEATAPVSTNTGGQPSFFKDVADIGRKILPTRRVASTPTEENLRMQEHFRPGEPQLSLGGSRERRLEQFQAGISPTAAQAATQPQPPREAAPNMPTTSATERLMIPQPGLESEARRTYAQPRAAETTGQKTSSQIATSTAVSGRLPAESSDPRRRYMEMARMSLEDREKLLNSLPVGQRPIQVIRGNQESWYSPGMSREFATIPEAMSGIQGRPTYQSEEDRAQAEASRSAVSARQSQRIAAEERMLDKQIEAGKYERAGKAGTAHGSGGEKWKVEKVVLPDGTEAIHQYDEGTGKHITIRPGDANQVSGVLSGYNYEDSKTRQMALDMLTGLGDQAAIDNTFRNQPDHVQKAIMQAIKERKEQEKKK